MPWLMRTTQLSLGCWPPSSLLVLCSTRYAACLRLPERTMWLRQLQLVVQVSTEATNNLTAGAVYDTLFSQPLQVGVGLAMSTLFSSFSMSHLQANCMQVAAPSMGSTEVATLMGQTDVAGVIAAPAMVNGNSWVFEIAAVLVPEIIATAL